MSKPMHRHWGHQPGEWSMGCCACPGAAPDPGCKACQEDYYKHHEPALYDPDMGDDE